MCLVGTGLDIVLDCFKDHQLSVNKNNGFMPIRDTSPYNPEFSSASGVANTHADTGDQRSYSPQYSSTSSMPVLVKEDKTSK